MAAAWASAEERLTHFYRGPDVVVQILRRRRQKTALEKFQIDPLGDHLCTCTAHSGAKKAHDWAVDQLADLFRTTTKVKTQQVVKSRGHHSGDIEVAGFLANAEGPVSLAVR